jgi:hypothetical protein
VLYTCQPLKNSNYLIINSLKTSKDTCGGAKEVIGQFDFI